MKIYISQPYFFSQLGRRESQEDSLCPAEASEQTSYFVVCDGVGGRDKGEVASRLVCQTFEESLSYDSNKLEAKDVLMLVEKAYRDLYSNRAVSSSMATTLAFMAKTASGMLLAHLGDSRIYQTRKGQGVIFRTKDHSLVNEWVEEGKITAEEAQCHPNRNIITKCIFVTKDSREYQTPTITLIRDIQPHDIFLICTDGVYEKATDSEIAEILTADLPLRDKAMELGIVCRDSSDNNTAWLVEVTDVYKQEEPAEDNITYTIKEHKKNKCSRFLDFIRKNIGFVKETSPLK